MHLRVKTQFSSISPNQYIQRNEGIKVQLSELHQGLKNNLKFQ